MYDKLFCENAKRVFLKSNWNEKIFLSALYRTILSPANSNQCTFWVHPDAAVPDSTIQNVIDALELEGVTFYTSMSGIEIYIAFIAFN